MSVTAYPLSWPSRWSRVPADKRQRAQFATSFEIARNNLIRELRFMGVDPETIVISSNIPLRRDGYPYSDYRNPDDPAVAVYFVLNGVEKCVPCDKWDRANDNLQAIRKTIESTRGISRWGTRDIRDAMFQGFNALPESSSVITEVFTDPWWDVLGVSQTADSDVVKAAYRALVKRHHPDVGGDIGVFARIQRAYEQYREKRASERVAG